MNHYRLGAVAATAAFAIITWSMPGSRLSHGVAVVFVALISYLIALKERPTSDCPAKESALERLERWCRKYYIYSVSTGNFTQPGDGLTVTLHGGGRTVSVGEHELARPDEDKWPTIEEVLHHALDLWYADRTPKRYLVFIRHQGPLPAGLSCLHWTGDTYMARVEAATEDEAKASLASNFAKPPEVIQLWEMTQGWAH